MLLGTRQQKPEIAYVLGDCGATLLIHEATLADRVPDAHDVPELMHRVAVDDTGAPPFAALIGDEPLPEPAEVGEQDTAMILYTSGTPAGRKARCWRIATSFTPR